MGDRSSIEWTEATWNPVTGCDRVSPGCDHCYALTLAAQPFSSQPKGGSGVCGATCRHPGTLWAAGPGLLPGFNKSVGRR